MGTIKFFIDHFTLTSITLHTDPLLPFHRQSTSNRREYQLFCRTLMRKEEPPFQYAVKKLPLHEILKARFGLMFDHGLFWIFYGDWIGTMDHFSHLLSFDL
jgi:hypothetical protein